MKTRTVENKYHEVVLRLLVPAEEHRDAKELAADFRTAVELDLDGRIDGVEVEAVEIDGQAVPA